MAGSNKMPKPTVSVITAAYNAESYIGDCINSVQAQTFQDWDMWIVDDHSSDATEEIVRSMTESLPNIHYIRLDENTGGPARPRNVALGQAQGRFVAFLDGDDMFMPKKLQRQIDFMRQKECAISYTGMRRISGDGMTEGHYIPAVAEIDYKGYLGNTCIPFSSSMIDRSMTGPLHMPEDVPHGRDDTALWISLLKQGHRACGLDMDLTRFRQGHGSLSSHFLKMAAGNWDIYRRYAGELGVLQLSASFFQYGARAVAKRLEF